MENFMYICIMKSDSNIYFLDLNPDMFGEKFLSVGGFFQRGCDKDGCRIFVIKPKTRTDEKTDELKKLLLYWFDRLER